MNKPEQMKQNMKFNLSMKLSRPHIAGHKRRSGSVTVVVALASTALLGFGAIATDYGLMVAKRNHLQRACDAAALAGAYDLPLATSSLYSATIAANQNNVALPIVTFPNGVRQISVAASQTLSFFFARAIGIPSGTVAARATAERVPLKGVPGAVPLAITTNDYYNYRLGVGFTELMIDNNRQNFGDGNLVALDLRNDTSGKAVAGFQYDVQYGTDKTAVIGQQISTALNASLQAQGKALVDAMNDRITRSAGAPWFNNGTNYTFPNYASTDPRIVTIVVADPNFVDNNNPQLTARLFAPVYVDQVTGSGGETYLRLRILPKRDYSTEDPGIIVGDENTPDTGIGIVRLIN